MTKDRAIKSAKFAVAHSKTPTPYVIHQSRNGQWMYCSLEYASKNHIHYEDENVFWFHDFLNHTGRGRMAKQYYHRFVVEGAHYFPLDMLRYDTCWPSTSGDVNEIILNADQKDLETKRRIQLTTIGHKDWKPTLRRWQSFGWDVLECVKGTEV